MDVGVSKIIIELKTMQDRFLRSILNDCPEKIIIATY